MFALRDQGHQGRAEGLCLPGHGADLALAVRHFIGVYALLDIGTAVLEQTLDQARQFMGGGGEGFWGPKPCLHTPEKGPIGTLRVVHTACGETQGDDDAMRAGTHPPRQHLPAGDLVLGTQPQPAPAGLHAGPLVSSKVSRCAVIC